MTEHVARMSTAMGVEEGPECERGVDPALAVARTAWPMLELSRSDVADAVRQRGVPFDGMPPELVADVLLAQACVKNQPGALVAFRGHVFPSVSVAVRRFDDAPHFVDEVYQRLSEAMFVGGPDGRPKILLYSGDGPLAAFVATAARRIALRLATGAARFQGEAELVERFSNISEQETELLRRRHGETINRALAMALRRLPRRERLILRMNLVEGVSTARIAAMYNVSQPTVSRWIHRSARSIYAAVKEMLCDELEVDTQQLQSLLCVFRSQIEVTISLVDASRSVPSG